MPNYLICKECSPEKQAECDMCHYCSKTIAGANGTAAQASTAMIKINPQNELEYLRLKEQVEGLAKYAAGRKITADIDLKPAGEDLVIILKVKKPLEELKKQYVSPIDIHLKAVRKVFDDLLNSLEEATKINKSKINAYNQEKERKIREIEEVNRQAEELARKQARLNEGVFTVDTTPIPVPEPPVKKVSTVAGGFTTTKIPKWRLVDITKVPEKYKILDAVLIGRVVRAGEKEITGIEIYYEDSIRTNVR